MISGGLYYFQEPLVESLEQIAHLADVGKKKKKNEVSIRETAPCSLTEGLRTALLQILSHDCSYPA